METHTSINSLPDDLLFKIIKRSFKQPAASWKHYAKESDQIDKTPVPAPPSDADVTQNLFIASVCGRWRRLAKRCVTTLLVKEGLVVSRDDLSSAVACFPNLTHLHLSDNSVESLNDAFLSRLASSCPKLTRLHVGRSLASEHGKDYRKEVSITAEGLDRFFQKLPELEQVTLFCLQQETQLPDSFFRLGHLRTLLLTDASAADNISLTNLTALTTLYITFPWNIPHLSNLLHLPRLAHLSTLAPHQNHQPAGAASVTLSSCLESFNFLISCPRWDAIFPSASPFAGLKELLIANCSGLETVPDGIGDLLPCLRKLHIRNSDGFTHLPESFTSLTFLENLIVCHCERFTALPTSFGELPALKSLILEDLCLTELPPSFYHLTSLESLFIADCPELSQLPERFCRLTGLKELSVFNAEGCSLPEDVGALASLEALGLLACGQQSFPPSFTDLTSVTRLELYDCWAIESLPEALGELSSLRELKLSNLEIGMLPCSLIRLTRLQILIVQYCGALSEIPFRLCALVGLKSLELTWCMQLSEPPAGLPPSLETLCLGPFEEGSSLVVDISQLSQLRVLKLNRVGVTCGPAAAERFSFVNQLEQLEQMEQRIGGEGVDLSTSLSQLRSSFNELVEKRVRELKQAEQVKQEQVKQQVKQKLEQVEEQLEEQMAEVPEEVKREQQLKLLKQAQQEEQQVEEEVGQVGQVSEVGQVGQVGQVEEVKMRLEGEFQGLSASLPHPHSLFNELMELLEKRVQLEKPEQLEQLEQLEMFWKGSNQEPAVPLVFLPRLRSLLIKAPGISSLPVNMATAFPELRKLSLLSWTPEELPGSIGELSKLTSLMINAPRLVALPQGISSLARLRKLELFHCRALRHLPESRCGPGAGPFHLTKCKAKIATLITTSPCARGGFSGSECCLF
ncbi:unnamed protein product [Closterium sp. Naga37s-1]|nr:unnamed protein product [Closterium sp. Naga37s-1]